MRDEGRDGKEKGKKERYDETLIKERKARCKKDLQPSICSPKIK